MLKNKIMSTVLCGAMAVSFAGCNMFGSSKVSPSTLLSYVDNGETQVFESTSKFRSFLADSRNRRDEDALSKGGVISLKDNDIKKVMTDENISPLPIIDSFYSKDMTEATVYCSAFVHNETGFYEYAYAFTFEEEQDAESYFKKLHNGIQPNASNKKARNDSGEEDGIQYSVMNIIDDARSAGVGVYRDGKNLLFVLVYGYYDNSSLDEIDVFCKDLGLHLVTDT